MIIRSLENAGSVVSLLFRCLRPYVELYTRVQMGQLRWAVMWTLVRGQGCDFGWEESFRRGLRNAVSRDLM